MRRVINAILAATFVVAQTSSAHAVSTYIATEIPGVTRSDLSNRDLVGLNDAGQFTMRKSVSSPAGGWNVVRRTLTTTTDLGRPANFIQAYAKDINNSGYIAGTAYVGSVYLTGGHDAFIISPGGDYTPLLMTYGGEAGNVTSANEVFGSSYVSTGKSHATIWRKSGSAYVATDLGTYGATTDSYGIWRNNVGDMLMSSGNLSAGTNFANYLAREGQAWQALPTPGDGSYPLKVSDAREVVFIYGKVWTAANGFVTTGVDYVNDMNDQGQIVGQSTLYGLSAPQATLYEAGTLYDLNNLVTSGLPTGTTLESAYWISENGQIIAVPPLVTGAEKAYLLTPVPEPTTWALLAIAGAAALLGSFGRRRDVEVV